MRALIAGCIFLLAVDAPVLAGPPGTPGLEFDVMDARETPEQAKDRFAARRAKAERMRRAQLRHLTPEQIRAIQRDIVEQAGTSGATDSVLAGDKDRERRERREDREGDDDGKRRGKDRG